MQVVFHVREIKTRRAKIRKVNVVREDMEDIDECSSTSCYEDSRNQSSKDEVGHIASIDDNNVDQKSPPHQEGGMSDCDQHRISKHVPTLTNSLSTRPRPIEMQQEHSRNQLNKDELGHIASIDDDNADQNHPFHLEEGVTDCDQHQISEHLPTLTKSFSTRPRPLEMQQDDLVNTEDMDISNIGDCHFPPTRSDHCNRRMKDVVLKAGRKCRNYESHHRRLSLIGLATIESHYGDLDELDNGDNR